MKIKKVKVLSILALTSFLNTAHCSTPEQNNLNTTDQQKSILSLEEKAILNMYLSTKISKVFQLKATQANATKILKIIDDLQSQNKNEDVILKAITNNKTRIIKSANEFFAILYPGKDIIKDLLQKALDSELSPNGIPSKNPEEYVTYNYFLLTEKETTSFFEETMTSVENIKKICNEFNAIGKILFNSFDDTLNEKIKESEEKILKKRKAKK